MHHAAMRMYERGIEPEDVVRVLDGGERIEDYPDDKPLASGLVLGQVGNRPLHIVVADDAGAGETLVVTVYEPDPGRWSPDFRRRKTP